MAEAICTWICGFLRVSVKGLSDGCMVNVCVFLGVCVCVSCEEALYMAFF